MQTQSRLAMSGGSASSSASEDEHEAVIRELTRGKELTAQLQAAALRALRGQGQAEATAEFILGEVSRAFTVCLTIMGSPDRAPPPPEMPGLGVGMAAAAASAAPSPPQRRNRDDSIPREQRTTSSPHYDGYQWRKYGQKRITKTQYPRCYFRCSFHRERNCRATKQVQQCSNGDPPQYLVMYFNEHTCDNTAWEPEAAAVANPAAAMLDLSGAGLVARRGGAPLLDERGVQEEHERLVFVSSLTRVLGGHQFQHNHQSPPDAAVAVNVAHQEPPPQRAARGTRDAPAPAAVDAAAELPGLDVDVEGVGLDVMDYDVTGELCFGNSYSGGGLPF